MAYGGVRAALGFEQMNAALKTRAESRSGSPMRSFP